MQSPGRPEEDPSGGFQYGGWASPYDYEVSGEVMEKQLEPSDLLLGRKTFEMLEAYWPTHADFWPSYQEVTKYVVSSTLKETDRKNSIILESLADIEKLKNSGDAELKIWGSSKLVQLLLSHDLVDELWLNIHPIILGKGKKLFNDGAFPATFTLVESLVTASGVIMANYKRNGAVKTGIMVP
jgi:dihydrofolate reductase